MIKLIKPATLVGLGIFILLGIPVQTHAIVTDNKPNSALKDRLNLNSLSASPAAQIQEHQQLIRERVKQMKDKLASQQAERKVKLEENAKEHIRNRFQRMIIRMEAAIERFNQIINRIDTRLNRLAEKNIDTQKLSEQLTASRQTLTDTESLLIAAKAEFDNQVLSSDNPRVGFDVIKDTIKQFVDKMKGLHRQLRDIVVQIRIAGAQAETDGT